MMLGDITGGVDHAVADNVTLCWILIFSLDCLVYTYTVNHTYLLPYLLTYLLTYSMEQSPWEANPLLS
jgi:hypothetical protein